MCIVLVAVVTALPKPWGDDDDDDDDGYYGGYFRSYVPRVSYRYTPRRTYAYVPRVQCKFF